MQKPIKFAGEAHYIGSLPKGDHVRDYYQIIVDGVESYVYVRVKPDGSTELEG